MKTKNTKLPMPQASSTAIVPPASVSELLHQYGCGPIALVGTENAFYERHLVFDRVIDPRVATARESSRHFPLHTRPSGAALGAGEEYVRA